VAEGRVPCQNGAKEDGARRAEAPRKGTTRAKGPRKDRKQPMASIYWYGTTIRRGAAKNTSPPKEVAQSGLERLIQLLGSTNSVANQDR